VLQGTLIGVAVLCHDGCQSGGLGWVIAASGGQCCCNIAVTYKLVPYLLMWVKLDALCLEHRNRPKLPLGFAGLCSFRQYLDIQTSGQMKAVLL
jgi:hypothetical protein